MCGNQKDDPQTWLLRISPSEMKTCIHTPPYLQQLYSSSPVTSRSAGEWVNRPRYIRTAEHCSAIRRKEDCDTCDNADGSSGHCAEWEKPGSRWRTVRFHLRNILEKADHRAQERDQWLPGVKGEGEGGLFGQRAAWGTCREHRAVLHLTHSVHLAKLRSAPPEQWVSLYAH